MRASNGRTDHRPVPSWSKFKKQILYMRPIFSIRDKPSPSCVECEYCVECECVSKVQYLVMLLSQVYDKTA